MSHRVVWCPPVGDSPSFDPHQFANRRHKSSQLTFNDLARTHILRVGDKKPARRTETPQWAMSDESLREVLVFYLEGRLYVRNQSGTPHERLARCRAAAESQVPRKRAQLQAMVDGYRELSRLPGTKSSDLQRLEQQIGNTDTDIFVATKLPEIVCTAAYLYHRLCWNSCSVAEHLGISACHVRQILYRLGKAAERMKRLSANSGVSKREV